LVAFVVKLEFEREFVQVDRDRSVLADRRGDAKSDREMAPGRRRPERPVRSRITEIARKRTRLSARRAKSRVRLMAYPGTKKTL
jgi:hypothetical protein